MCASRDDALREDTKSGTICKMTPIKKGVMKRQIPSPNLTKGGGGGGRTAICKEITFVFRDMNWR